MREVDLPPDAATLMTATRAIGYSLEAAISDIVDNSIAAHANKIQINYFPNHKTGPFISILDNGDGMSPEEIQNAMRYGSKDPNEFRDRTDLGRFGLGLKMASMSQCRKLTVLTKQSGVVCGCCWDLDHVIKVGSWSLLVLDESEMVDFPGFSEFIKNDKGTLVIWQELDRLCIGENDPAMSMGRKMDEVCRHLSLVYHRFLSGSDGLKKINLTVNNEIILPNDPFSVNKSTLVMDPEMIKIGDEKITVTAYTLPHPSKLSKAELDILGGSEGLRKNQGFYVYRGKRLLVWGTWFRLMRKGELTKLSRVMVDIPNSLDELWTLDVKKSTASPPEDVRKNLKIIIDKITGGSKRTYTYRGKKETSDKFIHFWNRIETRDGVIYSINQDHPLIIDFKENFSNSADSLVKLFQQIEGNLPLNALHNDITCDARVENETMFTEKEIIQYLKSILLEFPSGETRKVRLELLRSAEPFCKYMSAIEVAEENGELL
ncbi:MAG: ATP-binding protein [Bacilli bacterium]|nr:ATP-binding protein [Bacilli bacterium]